MLLCFRFWNVGSATDSDFCSGVMLMDDLKRNGFGYYDPTAYKALKNILKKEAKQRKKVHHESKRISSSGGKAGQTY